MRHEIRGKHPEHGCLTSKSDIALDSNPNAGSAASALSKADAKLPIHYETACRELVLCRTIDEAKYWDDKSQVLAAWSKIYRSQDAAIEAKRLRLHAYRRMGELAAELRPVSREVVENVGSRFKPGPSSLLREHGLNTVQVNSSRFLANLPKADFEQIVASPQPPSPGTARHRSMSSSTEWSLIRSAIWQLRSNCGKMTAEELARSLNAAEAASASQLVGPLLDWFVSFGQHLAERRRPN